MTLSSQTTKVESVEALSRPLAIASECTSLHLFCSMLSSVVIGSLHHRERPVINGDTSSGGDEGNNSLLTAICSSDRRTVRPTVQPRFGHSGGPTSMKIDYYGRKHLNITQVKRSLTQAVSHQATKQKGVTVSSLNGSHPQRKIL